VLCYRGKTVEDRASETASFSFGGTTSFPKGPKGAFWNDAVLAGTYGAEFSPFFDQNYDVLIRVWAVFNFWF
jgi:hypothetical protein